MARRGEYLPPPSGFKSVPMYTHAQNAYSMSVLGASIHYNAHISTKTPHTHTHTYTRMHARMHASTHTLTQAYTHLNLET